MVTDTMPFAMPKNKKLNSDTFSQIGKSIKAQLIFFIFNRVFFCFR